MECETMNERGGARRDYVSKLLRVEVKILRPDFLATR
jgi:hypothetical protein